MEIPPSGLAARGSAPVPTAADAIPVVPGQTVEAVVTAVRPRVAATTGFLLDLSVPGFDGSLEASSDRALEPGSRIALRFVDSGMARVERIIENPRPPLAPAPAQQALREALPLQQPLADALRGLSRALAVPTLPDEVRREVERLLNNLPSAATVSTAADLRSAIAASGTFLEAHLQRTEPAVRHAVSSPATMAASGEARPAGAAPREQAPAAQGIAARIARLFGLGADPPTVEGAPPAGASGGARSQGARVTPPEAAASRQPPVRATSPEAPPTEGRLAAPPSTGNNVRERPPSAPPSGPQTASESGTGARSGPSSPRETAPAIKSSTPARTAAPSGQALPQTSTSSRASALTSPSGVASDAAMPRQTGGTVAPPPQTPTSTTTSAHAPTQAPRLPIADAVANSGTMHRQSPTPGTADGPAPADNNRGQLGPLAPLRDRDVSPGGVRPTPPALPTLAPGDAELRGATDPALTGGPVSLPRPSPSGAPPVMGQERIPQTPRPQQPAGPGRVRNAPAVTVGAAEPEQGPRPTEMVLPRHIARDSSMPPQENVRNGETLLPRDESRPSRASTTATPASPVPGAPARMPEGALPSHGPAPPGEVPRPSTPAPQRAEASPLPGAAWAPPRGAGPVQPATQSRRTLESATPEDGAFHAPQDTDHLQSDLKASLARVRGALLPFLARGSSVLPEERVNPILPQAEGTETEPLYNARGLFNAAVTRRTGPGHVGARQPEASIAATAQEESLEQLLRVVESALARTRMHQLAGLHDPRGATDITAPLWSVELPIPAPGGFDSLWLRLEESGGRRQAQSEGAPSWSVMLCLDCASLGPIHALVRLSGQQLLATLWAEREDTLLAARAAIADLEDALRAQGVDVERVECLHGRPAEAAGLRFGNLLDVRT